MIFPFMLLNTKMGLLHFLLLLWGIGNSFLRPCFLGLENFLISHHLMANTEFFRKLDLSVWSFMKSLYTYRDTH